MTRGRVYLFCPCTQLFTRFKRFRTSNSRAFATVPSRRYVQILSSAPFDSPAALPLASRQARSWQAFLVSNALSERSEPKGLPVLPSPALRRRVPCVYLVRCADHSLYGGWTTNVEARVVMHNEGRGGSYTRQRRPVTLVFVETHGTIESATRRERQIKRWIQRRRRRSFSGDAGTLRRLGVSHSSPRFGE